MVPENLGVPLQGDRDAGELCGAHQGCQVLCYSTATSPKMLVDLFAKNKSISFHGCALQFLVFCIFANSEYLLLAVMPCDQYKAISSPLFYEISMSSKVCSLLVAGVYLVGMADALIHTTLAFHLCFCGSSEINHFFCDLTPLYLLSCSDTQVNGLTGFIVFGVIELEEFFRSSCLLLLYHPCSLKDPFC